MGVIKLIEAVGFSACSEQKRSVTEEEFAGWGGGNNFTYQMGL